LKIVLRIKPFIERWSHEVIMLLIVIRLKTSFKKPGLVLLNISQTILNLNPDKGIRKVVT
jgi:hypothetical protein